VFQQSYVFTVEQQYLRFSGAEGKRKTKKHQHSGCQVEMPGVLFLCSGEDGEKIRLPWNNTTKTY
jgi:hypothetical protein